MSPIKKRTLKLSFDVSDDHTAKLNVEVQETGQKVSKLVQATERLRDRQPLPDSEIDRLNNLDKEAAQYVVGVDEILTEIRKAVVPMRDGRGKHLTVDTARDPPFVIMLLGLTSTGKTQTPKAIAKVLFGSDRAFVNLGFGGATSAQEVKNLIFGYKEGGQVFESEFIKAHRATGGQMIVNLDELANVKDPNWLYPLYDLLREATAGGFIRPDGTTGSLVMSNIIFVITGNATQEFWARVPNHLPLDVQMLAYSEIARNLRERPSMVRDSLENIFPKALLARVKSYRTFVVSPHTYKSIRQLTHLKVLEAIRNIGTGTGKRTWKLTFPDHNEYLKIVELIERDGFQITEQGASIDGYVDRLFSNEILAALYENKIQSEKTVSITYEGEKEVEGELINGKNPSVQLIRLTVDDGRTIDLKIKATMRDPDIKGTKDALITTAAHEAGHLFTDYVLFKNKMRFTRVSIIPGVTASGVVFDGVQSSSLTERYRYSPENIVRQVATLAAGWIGQSMVSADGTDDAGKSNDMETATRLIQKSILKWGNSAIMGRSAFPDSWTMDQVLSSMSPSQKDALQKEVNAVLTEAETRARVLLENNFEVFVELTLKLVAKGDMREADIKEFFEQHKDRVNMTSEPSMLQSARVLGRSILERWSIQVGRAFRRYKEAPQDSLYRADLPQPESIADIEAFARAEKERQIREVPLPKNIPINPISHRPIKFVSNLASQKGEYLEAASNASPGLCNQALSRK